LRITQRRSWQLRVTAYMPQRKQLELPPDIVIPDLNARGMNGIETGKRIRERTRSTAKVFLTGIIDGDIRLEVWVSATLT